MKFTSLPKKLLLTGMSAAMVVAFAPAVAQAAVTTTDSSAAVPSPTVSADTVATLNYTANNTNYTETFKSTQTYTDDDALQAALTKAAQVSEGLVKGITGAKDVTVTVSKDVTVGNVSGNQDEANYAYAMAIDGESAGLVAAGKVKIDLGAHTITNTTANDKDAEGKAVNSGDKAYTAQTPVLTVETNNYIKNNKAATKTVSVYSMEKTAKAAAADSELQAEDGTTTELPEGAELKDGGNTPYYKNGDVKNNAFTTTKGNGTTDGPYYKYTYEVSEGQNPTSGSVEADSVTVTNGTIASATTKEAVDVKRGTLTLDGATVSSTKAAATVRNDRTVVLQGNATVSATLDQKADNDGDGKVETADNQGNLTAIKGGTVEFGKARKDGTGSRDSVATITATLTNGGANDETKGTKSTAIDAETVTAYNGATVTASAGGATNTGKGSAGQTSQNQPGIIGGNTAGTATTATVSSTAVKASKKAQLNYGNYMADVAVDATGSTDSSISYGTYSGYLKGGLNIYGGKFKYDPTAKGGFEDSDGNKLQKQYTLPTLSRFQKAASYKAASNDGWTYVYREGTTAVSYGEVPNIATNVKGEGSSINYMNVAVPAGATNAKGKAYKSGQLTEYVNEKYLDGATQAEVFAESDLGKSLNDGNSQKTAYGEDQPTLDVQVNAQYGTPTAEAAKAGDYETAYNELKAQADANQQTAQGIYTVSAQQNYGTSKGKAAKHADIASLGDAPLAVTAQLVQTNSDAKAYKLGETNTEVAVTTPQSVGDVIYGTATFQVSEPGSYGVTVTTNKDAQAQQNAAAAKAVSDAIAALPTEVTADNATSAANAVAAAQAAYTGLTADQKALVTNKDALDAAQKAVDDYAAKAQADAEAAQKAADEAAQKAADEKTAAAQQAAADAQAKAEAAQKAADEAKADYEAAQARVEAQSQTVKGLKVKAGKKKATVSWKKASGYKYQLKYRQKNSSKTADFKYKKTSATKVTVKGLKSKKYYNFKVRTYKTVSGKTVYGKWTSIVTAKIK